MNDDFEYECTAMKNKTQSTVAMCQHRKINQSLWLAFSRRSRWKSIDNVYHSELFNVN